MDFRFEPWGLAKSVRVDPSYTEINKRHITKFTVILAALGVTDAYRRFVTSTTVVWV